jgi:hypothetical protein
VTEAWDQAHTTWTTSSTGGNGFWLNGQWFPLIAGGSEDADGDGTSTDNEDGTPPADGDDGKSTDGGKTFTQDEVNALVTREVSKAARGKLDPKELGFDSAKDMKTFIDEMKSKQEADKSEEDKAKEEAITAAADAARNEVLTVANQRLVKAEFLTAAADAGISKDARNDAFVLAQTLEDWATVEVDDDGNVKGFDDTFFATLKEAKPFLFSSEPPIPDAGAGRSGGGKDGDSRVKELQDAYGNLSPTLKAVLSKK